jgi:hypothetical protein
VATETGPDLSFARRTVESLMDDTCVVVRPRVLDEEGLAEAPRIYPPEDDPAEDGPCMVGDESVMGSPEASDAYRFAHRASLPAETLGVQEGDVLIVKTSRRDPDLPGNRYVVRRVGEKTFLLTRRLVMERFETLRQGWHDDEEPEL